MKPGCKKMIKRLALYLDAEVEDADCADIQDHLAGCERCGGYVGFERDLKELIRRKCREQEVPLGLEERLRAQIRHVLR